jgi:O-antigen ligase
MTAAASVTGHIGDRQRVRAVIGAAGLAGAVFLTGGVVAYLLAAGLWFVVVALLVALPAFVVLHRVPLAAIVIWAVAAPYLLQTGGAVRYAYWTAHRALPVAVLVVLVASRMLGIRTRPLGRLGAPELLMAGYLVVSLLSVGYTAVDAAGSFMNLYDRVVIPMCLYLVVRLARPSDEALRLLVPVAALTVLAQGAVGAASWISPGMLPTDWLGREGTRTVGSLGSPSVYGVTMLAAGAFCLHAAASERRPAVRIALRVVFAVAVLMAVVTFTRGVWLAAVLVVVATAIVHPHQLRRVALAVVPIIVVLLLTGAASGQIRTIEARFGNEQTALSRLPVALASWRMLEEKPLTGWGFGNFDEFDRDFQAEASGFFPEKDHSSHNLYLTLLAEQGLIGTLLFLGPAIWLLARTVAVYPWLPRSGWRSRKLVVLLWGVLAAHVAVNNFSNMKVVFGLGQWWLVLGIIATLVSSRPTREPDLPSPLRARH